jgi:hypothetical protein
MQVLSGTIMDGRVVVEELSLPEGTMVVSFPVPDTFCE